MRSLFLIAMMISSFVCSGKDLGTYGSTYIITEPDILEDIESKLWNYERSGELKKFQNKYREEIKKQIKRPNRVIGITNAEESRVRKFDPTTELEEDIVIPKTTSGEATSGTTTSIINPDEMEYEVLYKTGTKINPLDHMLFNEPLIFIDGEIEIQREFANKYQDKNPLAKIILINGKPGIQKEGDKEYYYYFDQWGAYSARFDIVVVPSVVYQANNERALTIEEVGLNEGQGTNKKQAQLIGDKT